MIHLLVYIVSKYVSNDIIIGLCGNRSKAPDKKPPDNKPPRIIAKYADDSNQFRLGSTNPKKNSSPCFFGGFYTGGLLLGGFWSRTIYVLVYISGR